MKRTSVAVSRDTVQAFKSCGYPKLDSIYNMISLISCSRENYFHLNSTILSLTKAF